MSDHNPYSAFTTLSTDITERILSLLPIPTLIRASSVCKSWRSIISAPSFSALIAHNTNASPRPWFFLFGLHNTSSRNNQSFAFDPASNSWFHLPPAQEPRAGSCFIGANGFFFTTTPRFGFSRILNTSWHLTSPLRFSRINPLVGVFYDPDRGHCDLASGFACNLPKFIVVGGVRFIGGLVDIEDRLAVEIYDPHSDSWELCPPLPADFRSGYSSQYLSSALFRARFYVFGIYSFSVSSFDLKKHVWSEVQTLRPPGVMFSFLIASQNMLVLAGMCNAPRGPSFNLWKVDELSMEFSEIAIMPHDFLYSLVDTEEDDKFASLKCVGLGNLIYVFNEEYHKKYPACVCEIGTESDKCSWRRLPQLPSPVNEFHKVISFCSTVSLHNIIQCE